MVIGDCFVCHGTQSLEAHLSALVDSEDLGSVDNLSGRFAVLILDTNGLRIVQDAFGARTVCFDVTPGPIVAASHSALLAFAIRSKIGPAQAKFTKMSEYRNRTVKFLPGRISMFEGIVFLTPNHVLNANDRSVKRFWPRKPVSATTPDDLRRVTVEYFERFSAYFETAGLKAVVGLSGGKDCQVSIAGLNRRGVISDLVTWLEPFLDPKELPSVERRLGYLAIRHRFVDLKQIKPEDDVKIHRASEVAGGFGRSASKLTVAMRVFAGRDHVHIRGYGGEIIRGFYTAFRHKRELLNALKTTTSKPIVKRDASVLFAEIFLAQLQIKKNTAVSEEYKAIVGNYFKDFTQSGSYEASDVLGYDLSDLYYWEHRMAIWGAQMLNEMDPAVYNMVAMNSRKLFEVGFGLPAPYRFGPDLMLDMCRAMDSELATL